LTQGAATRVRGFDDLLRALREDGYQVLGPTVVHDTVMLRPIRSVDELPRGVRDEQDGGRYRLTGSTTPIVSSVAVGSAALVETAAAGGGNVTARSAVAGRRRWDMIFGSVSAEKSLRWITESRYGRSGPA